MGNEGPLDSYTVVDLLDDSRLLLSSGTATATGCDGGITGLFDGSIALTSSDDSEFAVCTVADHRMVLNPR